MRPWGALSKPERKYYFGKGSVEADHVLTSTLSQRKGRAPQPSITFSYQPGGQPCGGGQPARGEPPR